MSGRPLALLHHALFCRCPVLTSRLALLYLWLTLLHCWLLILPGALLHLTLWFSPVLWPFNSLLWLRLALAQLLCTDNLIRAFVLRLILALFFQLLLNLLW